MKDMDIVRFLPSDELYDKAARIYKAEFDKLRIVFPEADIQHVGSAAIPGAIGKFDVDIQIRVSSDSFDETIELMDLMYTQKHPHLWKDGFAIYNDYRDMVDYMVTVQGSVCDDFHRLRDYFIAHPADLAAYNELKVRHHGRQYRDYREAKQVFLGGNGTTRFLHR